MPLCRSVGSAPNLLRLACSVALAVPFGCSEPRFAHEGDGGCDGASCAAENIGDASASDADLNGEPTADAGPSTSDLPTWQAQLLGRYAARVHTFARDSLVGVRSDELAIVDMVRVGEELEMHYRTCTSTSVSFNFPGSTQVQSPEAIPLRKLPVRFDGEHWSTLPTATPVGYAAEPLVPCTPGERVQAAPEQVWTDTCVCPSSNSAPTRADDCRVQDSDHDDLPGMSVDVDAAIDAVFWGVLDKRDGFVEGSLDKGGARFAQVLSDGTSHLFGCNNPPCELAAPLACSPVVNSALFVRLDEMAEPAGGWDCQAVLIERDRLFPLDEPTFPPEC